MRLPLSSCDITSGWKRRAFLSTTAAISAGALLVGGCGGSGSKAAAPTTTTSTTVESAETRAWVAAAVQGVENSPDMKVSTADAECLGRALVETVTVERLKSAGVTKENLADPNADLPPRLGTSLAAADRKALGAALQACGGGIFGSLIAAGLAEGIGNGYQLDSAAKTCVDRWFSSADRQMLIASSVLDTNLTASDASQFADLIVTCLDVASLIEPSMHIAFDSTERACVNQLARTSPQLRAALQLEMTGSADGSTTHLEELFGASIVKCLTPEHLLQLGKANTGGATS